MLHSWGLTMPPKLVHRKLQVSCFRSLGSSNRHAKTDTHCTHMHEDTPVRRGQGSGEKHRDDGREEGGRQATAVPLTVNQAREASGPECPKTLNQVGQTFLGRSSRGYRWWMHWGEWRGGGFTLNWGIPFQAGGQPGTFQWGSRGWLMGPHTMRWPRTPQPDGTLVSWSVWAVKTRGPRLFYHQRRDSVVQQGHAVLSTLRASRTHQENTPSYSRRQELGLAVVEQYSIKQTSVSFQSRARPGLEN